MRISYYAPVAQPVERSVGNEPLRELALPQSLNGNGKGSTDTLRSRVQKVHEQISSASIWNSRLGLPSLSLLFQKESQYMATIGVEMIKSRCTKAFLICMRVNIVLRARGVAWPSIGALGASDLRKSLWEEEPKGLQEFKSQRAHHAKEVMK